MGVDSKPSLEEGDNEQQKALITGPSHRQNQMSDYSFSFVPYAAAERQHSVGSVPRTRLSVSPACCSPRAKGLMNMTALPCSLLQLPTLLFPHFLLSKSHRIHQLGRIYEPRFVALRWRTSQGMLQRPEGRTDPQCHVLALRSATQQYGCVQDPVWEKSHQVTLGAWIPGRSSRTQAREGMPQYRGCQITRRESFFSLLYPLIKLPNCKGCYVQ